MSREKLRDLAFMSATPCEATSPAPSLDFWRTPRMWACLRLWARRGHKRRHNRAALHLLTPGPARERLADR